MLRCTASPCSSGSRLSTAITIRSCSPAMLASALSSASLGAVSPGARRTIALVRSVTARATASASSPSPRSGSAASARGVARAIATTSSVGRARGRGEDRLVAGLEQDVQRHEQRLLLAAGDQHLALGVHRDPVLGGQLLGHGPAQRVDPGARRVVRLARVERVLGPLAHVLGRGQPEVVGGQVDDVGHVVASTARRSSSATRRASSSASSGYMGRHSNSSASRSALGNGPCGAAAVDRLPMQRRDVEQRRSRCRARPARRARRRAGGRGRRSCGRRA